MARTGATHRTDGPHTVILHGLRRAGIPALSTSQLGGFVGDIAAPCAGRNWLLEVKPEGWEKPRDQRERDQQRRRREWRACGGQVDVVRTLEEALIVLGLFPVREGFTLPE